MSLPGSSRSAGWGVLLAVSVALCPAAAPAGDDAARLQHLEDLQTRLAPILLPEGQHYLSYQLVHLRWVADLAARDLTPEEDFVVDYLVWRLCKGDPPKWQALLDLDERDAAIADTLRRDYDDRSALHILPMPDAEQRQRLAAIDTTGRLAALRVAVRRGLAPALEEHRAELQQLVREDVAAALAACTKDYDDDAAVLASMRDAGWHAVPTSDDIEDAYQRLKALHGKLPSLSEDRTLDMELPGGALGPGATPMEFARERAVAYLEKRGALENEIIATADLALTHDDRDAVLRGLDGEFEFRAALRHQIRRLRWGRPAEILDLLIDLVQGYGAYCEGHSDVGVRLGANGEVIKPARQCANWLRKYGERWCADRRTPPLYALVETDESGNRVWRQGGWLRWRWMDAEAVEDLEADGRILILEGRRWVVPPETATTGISAVQQLRDKGCAVSELVVALDLNQLE